MGCHRAFGLGPSGIGSDIQERSAELAAKSSGAFKPDLRKDRRFPEQSVRDFVAQLRIADPKRVAGVIKRQGTRGTQTSVRVRLVQQKGGEAFGKLVPRDGQRELGHVAVVQRGRLRLIGPEVQMCLLLLVSAEGDVARSAARVGRRGWRGRRRTRRRRRWPALPPAEPSRSRWAPPLSAGAGQERTATRCLRCARPESTRLS